MTIRTAVTTRAVVALVAVSALLAGAVGLAVARGTSLPAGAEVEVTVPSGASVREIARRLDDAELIDHPRIFSLLARMRGADASLKAGRYRLVAGMGYGELIEVLRTGAVETVALTIPEGLTLREIAPLIAGFTGDSVPAVDALLADTALAESLGVPGPTLEGYLLPETYRFADGTPAADIIETMVESYRAFWGPRERALARALGLDEREVVTLASIVEEEARHPEERPIIAGVYLNRIEIGMLLQADPTVQYALGEPKARLLFSDIDAVAEHPYNTYTQAGLPPGPIASPGLASLHATLEPAEHSFLYFVAEPDGSHQFSRTLREHNNARNRIRRERETDPP